MAFGLALNKKLLMDTVIANAIVSNGGKLLVKVLKVEPDKPGSTSILNDATMQPVIGGALAFLAGMLLKNVNVQNIAIGLVATGVINPFLQKTLGFNDNFGSLADYDYVIDEDDSSLGAYIDNPEVSRNYSEFYK